MALTLTDIYDKLIWKNSPDHTTPINEDNLNHIENGIKNNNTGLRAAEQAINQNTSDIATNTADIAQLSQHLTELESEVPKMANPSLDFANPLHTFDNSHLTFTATKECYLLGSMNGNASASYGWDAKVNINSIPVYQLTGNGSTSGASSSLTVPLTKINVGDIVTITISNTQTASVNLHIFDVIS